MMVLDEGRGVAKIEFDYNDSQYYHYTITFYDGSTEPLIIPVASGQLKRKIVPNIPNAATADDSTFYLVPIAQRPGSYSQYIKVLANEGAANEHWEMLFIGNTDVDMQDYQKKIDNNIIKKTYKNYDPSTMYIDPAAPNVVGAINEHELVLGDTYDYTSNKITNLNTYHNDTVINALNDMGNLKDLEMWDQTTETPRTLVDAINAANADYEIVENTTVDRSKHIETYYLSKDANDGSPKTKQGETVEIPRVDVVQKTVADTNDYRTYDVKIGGELKDPNDTTDKPYGSIHIPKITIVRNPNPADDSLACEYYLQIEGYDWSQDRCGAKIEIGKDAIFKDIVIVTNTADNIPVAGCLKDEKSIDFIYTQPNGTDKHTYLPIKYLFKAYTGYAAININTDNLITLKLYDPDNLQALTQDENGLRLAKCTEVTYGVVKFATNAEVLDPNNAIEKAVRPYDLYNFAVNSASVKDDLQGFFVDPITGLVVNNTIIKALNELATHRVEKNLEAITSELNISEYKYERIPVAGTKDQLGDLIEVPKTLLNIKSINNTLTTGGLTFDPNYYTIYYLSEMDEPYDEGLYIYNDAWIKVSGEPAIIEVNELPTENIKFTSFYKIKDQNEVVERYTLSQLAIDAGMIMDERGIQYNTVFTDYDTIFNNWADWMGEELEADPDGLLYAVQRPDGTRFLSFNYKPEDGKVYYRHAFHDGTEDWVAFSTSAIPIYKINDMFEKLRYK